MELLIVGEMWDYVDTKGEKITHINRYVNDNAIPIVFGMADVLVLPYTDASSSGVGQIGMELGIPIISTRVGGLYEDLKNYDKVTFIKENDVDELKTALLAAATKKLRNDEDLSKTHM